MPEKLKPCPFCHDASETRTHIDETYMPPSMDGRRILVSVTVRHWCVPYPGVVASMITFRGRERADAIAAWNRRAGASDDR